MYADDKLPLVLLLGSFGICLLSLLTQKWKIDACVCSNNQDV